MRVLFHVSVICAPTYITSVVYKYPGVHELARGRLYCAYANDHVTERISMSSARAHQQNGVLYTLRTDTL